MIRTVSIAVGVLGVGFASVAGAEEVSLAASLTPGDKSSFVYTTELSQSPTGKLGQPFYLNYSLEFTTRVKKISERYADLEVRFSRIAVDSTLGEFDSSTSPEEDASNLMAQTFRPAIGKPFNARLDASTMRLLGVNGPDPGALPDMMVQLYGRVLGDKHLTETIQPAFRMKADPATASLGEKWSTSVTRSANQGVIEIRLDFKLDGVDDGTATIGIGGEHLIKVDGSTPVSQRMVEQKIVGEATWSLKDALLDEFRLEKSFTLGAGDEQFDLGVKVVEREQLKRTE